ncbi:MAG: MinD/ParA family protein [Planctomycetes bacterium]|nr:MinD/ParA family protein [Planctomycetota bacterium]
MTNVLRLAIVDPHDTTRDTLKTMFLSMDMCWLEAESSRYEFFVDIVKQTTPEVGVIGIDADPEKALRLIHNLREAAPSCHILVVSGSTDGQLILKAMRAGAKEFLTHPIRPEEMVLALDRIASTRGGGSDGRSRGCRMVAVAGATGGVGTTSLAVNLGCVLASDESNSVALVDLDLSLGDADVFLDTIPDYTLVDVVQNISRLDFSLLKRSMTKHASGLYLLPRPVHLQDISVITADDVQRVFGLLKASFSHVIVDLSKAYNAVDMAALKAVNQVLLVTQLDLPCLRNIVRLMMSFEAVDGLKEKVHVVVNRVGLDNGHISLKKAKETIGRDIFWQLPNDYRVMIEMRNNGIPLVQQAPRAGITQSIVALAEEISGGDRPTDEESGQAKGRWLNFWGRAKTKNA